MNKIIQVFTCLQLLVALNASGQNEYQQHFHSLGLKGSTTIYDYNQGKWFFTDSIDAHKPALPASTFKILNSLIALEYQTVRDENEIFKWDGQERSHLGNVIGAWNKDTNLKTAFKNSTIWFYVEISKKVGRSKYEAILNECDYGNGIFTEKGVDFWNYGDFQITPVNQIEFLVKLYENKLPFSKSSFEKVKRMMVSDSTATHVFRDKTGWTRKSGKDIAWWIGYVTTEKNVYFFATRIIKDEIVNNPNFPKARKEITKQILADIERNSPVNFGRN